MIWRHGGHIVDENKRNEKKNKISFNSQFFLPPPSFLREEFACVRACESVKRIIILPETRNRKSLRGTKKRNAFPGNTFETSRIVHRWKFRFYASDRFWIIFWMKKGN